MWWSSRILRAARSRSRAVDSRCIARKIEWSSGFSIRRRKFSWKTIRCSPRARRLFSLEGGLAASSEFGRAVHALLAEVEWASGDEADTWAKTWAKRGTEPIVTAEAVNCLRRSALASVWKKVPGAEVWRERE